MSNITSQFNRLCNFENNTSNLLFYSQFGTVADCEADCDQYSLYKFTSVTLNLSPECNRLLWFDADDTPSLLIYSYYISKDPQLDRLGGKLAFFKGEYFRDLRNRLELIFQRFDQISQELNNKPIDANYPMQDLKGRALRLDNLDEMRRKLTDSYRYSFSFYRLFYQNLSILELTYYKLKTIDPRRICCGVGRFIDGLYYDIGFRVNQNPNFNRDSVKFNQILKRINNVDTALDILGKFSYGDSCQPTFIICDTMTQTLYGVIEIVKKYKGVRPHNSCFKQNRNCEA